MIEEERAAGKAEGQNDEDDQGDLKTLVFARHSCSLLLKDNAAQPAALADGHCRGIDYILPSLPASVNETRHGDSGGAHYPPPDCHLDKNQDDP